MTDPFAKLVQFATNRDLDYIEAIREHGSMRAAARALGINKNTINGAIERLRARAAKQLPAMHDYTTNTVPDGYRIKGVSQYDTASRAWVKTERDGDLAVSIARDALAALVEEIPRVPAMPAPPLGLNADLLNCYVITDFHLNALSWGVETGADWDMQIGERTLLAWFAQAIAQSPQAETAVFAQLSDLLHSDGLEPLTPASKHVLDVDTRFAKVVRVVIRVLRQIIDMLLAKHQRVHIIMADANHDPVSQIWLREWLAVLFEQEPRITVDVDPSPFNAYEFGKTALFFHHGHKRKPANVSEVFASKFREMFGRTKHAYAHMGHLHHMDIKENNLMVVEQHRTLTAPDAYSARAGYFSGRDAQCITYHREWGEVSRVRVSYDMLR